MPAGLVVTFVDNDLSAGALLCSVAAATLQKAVMSSTPDMNALSSTCTNAEDHAGRQSKLILTVTARWLSTICVDQTAHFNVTRQF